jgi:purine-binding chemotaxis protein CheW
MKTLAEYYSEKDFRVLQDRAQRIKQSAKADSSDVLLEVLLVQLRGETYGLPVEGVLAIYENIHVTPLPGTPPFIAGIVNLRGNLVIVLDLAVVLEIPGERVGDENALVVVSLEGSQVVLLVNNVSEVSEVDMHDMTPTSALLNSKSSACLLGVLPNGTVLLNIQQLLNDQTLVVDQASY